MYRWFRTASFVFVQVVLHRCFCNASFVQVVLRQCFARVFCAGNFVLVVLRRWWFSAGGVLQVVLCKWFCAGGFIQLFPHRCLAMLVLFTIPWGMVEEAWSRARRKARPKTIGNDRPDALLVLWMCGSGRGSGFGSGSGCAC